MTKNSKRQFSITGPTPAYDPLTTAVRPDLADIALAEHHSVPYYVVPVAYRCICQTPLHKEANGNSDVVATLVLGEEFALLDIIGAWGWGYRQSDKIVGYCLCDSLSAGADDAPPQSDS